MPPTELVRAVHRSEDTMRGLADALLAGQASLTDWYNGMEHEIRLVHSSAAAAAEEENPDPISQDVEAQLNYLDAFARDIESGSQPLDGTLPQRAGMYARAALGTHAEAERRQAQAAGATQERRVLDPDAEHCQECIDAAALDWQPIGALPRIGDCQCLTNCACHFEFSFPADSGAAGFAWDEGLHHRGQPKNKGEFASTSGSSERRAAREKRELAYHEKVAKMRAKLGEGRIATVKGIVASLLPNYQHVDLYGTKVKAFNPAVPENVLVTEMMKQGLSDQRGTGLKAYKILDAMVFVGELIRHETGANDLALPGKMAVSYSLPRVKFNISSSADSGAAGFAWEESQHKRISKGGHGGGEFAPQGGGGNGTAPQGSSTPVHERSLSAVPEDFRKQVLDYVQRQGWNPKEFENRLDLEVNRLVRNRADNPGLFSPASKEDIVRDVAGQVLSQMRAESRQKDAADFQRLRAEKLAQPVPAPPSMGPSAAQVQVLSKRTPEQVDAHVKNLLGEHVTLQDVASIAGAAAGATVTVTPGRSKNSITVRIKHPDYASKRTIYRDLDGSLVMHNDEFFMKKGSGGKGLGAEVFGRQVEHAQRLGFSRIETFAGGPPYVSDMNGYYTWPRFGYDQRLDNLVLTSGSYGNQKISAAREKFPGIESVSDIFLYPGGAEWWKANGVGMPEATFDLKPNSRSLKVWHSYLAEKAARPGKVSMSTGVHDDGEIDDVGNGEENYDWSPDVEEDFNRAWEKIRQWLAAHGKVGFTFDASFSSNQPRVPRGQAGGGRFASTGDAALANVHATQQAMHDAIAAHRDRFESALSSTSSPEDYNATQAVAADHWRDTVDPHVHLMRAAVQIYRQTTGHTFYPQAELSSAEHARRTRNIAYRDRHMRHVSFAFDESKHPRGQPKNKGEFATTAHNYIRENGLATHGELREHLKDEHNLDDNQADAAVHGLVKSGHLKRTTEYNRPVYDIGSGPKTTQTAPDTVLSSFESVMKDGGRDVPDAFKSHLRSGLVPIFTLRQRSGLDHAKFDAALMDLDRRDLLRLVAIGNRSMATPEQLHASLPGDNETFFFVEPGPNHPRASFSADFARDQHPSFSAAVFALAGAGASAEELGCAARELFARINFAATPASPWVPYTGPRGGHGWRNPNTGRIVYGARQPGLGRSRQTAPGAPAPGTPKAQRADPTAVKAHIAQLLANPSQITSDAIREVKEQLLSMTVAQINTVKKDLGLKASGVKAELVAKVTDRALRKLDINDDAAVTAAVDNFIATKGWSGGASAVLGAIAAGNDRPLEKIKDHIQARTGASDADAIRAAHRALNDLANPPPVPPAPPAPTPAPQPQLPLPPPPVQPSSGLPAAQPGGEIEWSTGKPQPGTLNGIPFAPAPHHFWENVQDKDIGEPPPARKVDRVGIMIQEPDGRVWIVKPTNEFGNRTYTMPGGGVEPGLTDQQNALKEVWEETGLQVEITGHLGDFEDSNNQNNGRLYIGRRVGGAPWDAKIESFIIDKKTGKPAAESSEVVLTTPERAGKLLHRTDDLAQLMTVAPIPLDTPTRGRGSEPMKKFVAAIQPAANAYKQAKKAAHQSPGVAELHTVQELRGFNKKPQVVAKKDMDTLISQGGHIEMLRGISAAALPNVSATRVAQKLADDFRGGDHYPGFGIFGAGTYADATKGYSNIASSYAGGFRGGSGSGSGSAILRMAIPKTAKIVKFSELQRQVPRNPDKFTNQGATSDPTENWRGVQAALAGYDAIHVDDPKYGTDYYVVLNRGIVTVQKEDATGHQIK